MRKSLLLYYHHIKKTLVCKESTTYKISIQKEASIDWWSNWYEGDEIIAIIRQCEKEFIVEAVKIER